MYLGPKGSIVGYHNTYLEAVCIVKTILTLTVLKPRVPFDLKGVLQIGSITEMGGRGNKTLYVMRRGQSLNGKELGGSGVCSPSNF